MKMSYVLPFFEQHGSFRTPSLNMFLLENFMSQQFTVSTLNFRKKDKYRMQTAHLRWWETHLSWDLFVWDLTKYLFIYLSSDISKQFKCIKIEPCISYNPYQFWIMIHTDLAGACAHHQCPSWRSSHPRPEQRFLLPSPWLLPWCFHILNPTDVTKKQKLFIITNTKQWNGALQMCQNLQMLSQKKKQETNLRINNSGVR